MDPELTNKVKITEETDQEESVSQKPCPSLYVLFAALIASIGGILFGYDIGIVSGALLQLKGIFSLTSFQQELVVCGVLIGAFGASFFGGSIVDIWGRKTGITVSCGFFILGSVILFFSINFIMLIIGRIIIGIAVSLSVTSECTYISEISPPSRRGMMVSFNEVGITTGFLIAYLVNYLFISTPNGWKYMFGVATIPAILQVLGVALMPSSHHYLLIKGKTEKARKVLRNLRNNQDAEEEIEAIISSIDEQKNRRFLDLFSSTSNMRGRMILGMTLVFLQQFSGNANVLYYAPTVFQHFGYNSDTSATLVSVGLGIIKVLATIITLLIVDRVGRRSLLLVGSLLMATSIIILGVVGTVNQFEMLHTHKTVAIHHFRLNLNYSETTMDDQNNRENELENMVSQRNDTLENFKELNISSELLIATISDQCLQQFYLVEPKRNISSNEREIQYTTTEPTVNNEIVTDISWPLTSEIFLNLIDCNNSLFQNTTNDTSTETVSFSTKIISVLSLMTFVCAYSISYGPVTWLILSEIFPGSLRGRAVSVATCVNWGSNIIVSLTFLDILNAVGIGPTFVAYGIICYGAAIFIFFCVPETKNRSLEEINEILSKGMLRKNWNKAFTCNERAYSLRSPSFKMDTKCNSGKEIKKTDSSNQENKSNNHINGNI